MTVNIFATLAEVLSFEAFGYLKAGIDGYEADSLQASPTNKAGLFVLQNCLNFQISAFCKDFGSYETRTWKLREGRNSGSQVKPAPIMGLCIYPVSSNCMTVAVEVCG